MEDGSSNHVQPNSPASPPRDEAQTVLTIETTTATSARDNVSPNDESSDATPRQSDDSPVYWMTGHGRSVSNISYRSIEQHRPYPISLEDHSAESNELSQSCWAQWATVDEYVVVSGPTGIGAYVVWHCTVATLKGGDILIRKRYSEFDQLRADLVRSFSHASAMIPALPRKSIVSKFRPWFLEQRKAGLTHFLNCVLLNPEFAASPILKDFIFS